MVPVVLRPPACQEREWGWEGEPVATAGSFIARIGRRPRRVLYRRLHDDPQRGHPTARLRVDLTARPPGGADPSAPAGPLRRANQSVPAWPCGDRSPAAAQPWPRRWWAAALRGPAQPQAEVCLSHCGRLGNAWITGSRVCRCQCRALTVHSVASPGFESRPAWAALSSLQSANS